MAPASRAQDLLFACAAVLQGRQGTCAWQPIGDRDSQYVQLVPWQQSTVHVLLPPGNLLLTKAQQGQLAYLSCSKCRPFCKAGNTQAILQPMLSGILLDMRTVQHVALSNHRRHAHKGLRGLTVVLTVQRRPHDNRTSGHVKRQHLRPTCKERAIDASCLGPSGKHLLARLCRGCRVKSTQDCAYYWKGRLPLFLAYAPVRCVLLGSMAVVSPQVLLRGQCKPLLLGGHKLPAPYHATPPCEHRNSVVHLVQRLVPNPVLPVQHVD